MRSNFYIYIYIIQNQNILTVTSRMKRDHNLSRPRRSTIFLFLVTLLLFCVSLKTCQSMGVYRGIYPWRSMDLSTSNPKSDKIDAQTSTKSHNKTQGAKKKDEVSQYASKLITNNLLSNFTCKSIDD